MTKAGIKIENVHLSFGQTEVLKGVNLDIKPGEFFAFLGPSGSGKSTLLRAIAGFGPNPKGRILIGDRDVVGLDHGFEMSEWCSKAMRSGRICGCATTWPLV